MSQPRRSGQESTRLLALGPDERDGSNAHSANVNFVAMNICLPASSLSNAQHRVLEVITSNPEDALHADAGMIANAALVHPSTVTRTAQALGFRGWPNLRLALRKQHSATYPSDGATPNSRRLHEHLRQDAKALERTIELNKHFPIESSSTALATARTIIVLGSGSMRGPALVFADAARDRGYRVIEADDSLALASTLRDIGNEDILVIFNSGAHSAEINVAAHHAKTSDAGVLLITSPEGERAYPEATFTFLLPSSLGKHHSAVTAATALAQALVDTGSPDTAPLPATRKCSAA